MGHIAASAVQRNVSLMNNVCFMDRHVLLLGICDCCITLMADRVCGWFVRLTLPAVSACGVKDAQRDSLSSYSIVVCSIMLLAVLTLLRFSHTRTTILLCCYRSSVHVAALALLSCLATRATAMVACRGCPGTKSSSSSSGSQEGCAHARAGLCRSTPGE